MTEWKPGEILASSDIEFVSGTGHGYLWATDRYKENIHVPVFLTLIQEATRQALMKAPVFGMLYSAAHPPKTFDNQAFIDGFIAGALRLFGELFIGIEPKEDT